jgi:type IV secretion system protein VirB5
MYAVTKSLPFAFLLALLLGAPAARAQWAVVDAGALVQLVQEVQTMQQQLSTAQNQLQQTQQEFQSITGNRGMENLLAGATRNYLPPSWTELANVLQNSSGRYGALGASMQSTITANAVLSAQQLTLLPPTARQAIDAGRQSAALLQVLSHAALANTSNRFDSIQQLINAIPAARDQKAILDLLARISAEQGMLGNEQTKIQVLYQVAQAQEWTRQQREVEQAIAGHGRYATRFRPTP